MSDVVNIHDAKTHFSRLIERVQAGEEITIARAGKPVARLLAVTDRPARRVPGMDRDKVIVHGNFDDPVPEWDVEETHPDDPLRDLLR